MKVTGIHHVSLKCRGTEHFEQALAFYRDILRLSVLRTWGEGTNAGAMLDTGCGIVELFANAPDTYNTGAIRHFAFSTDNAEACVRAVEAAGYAITAAPKDIMLPSESPCLARVAFCVGPVGETIEFFEKK